MYRTNRCSPPGITFRRLARRSEKIGYDLTLIAELNLNDIKGVDAPSLDAWSTAAALAAITESLELSPTLTNTSAAVLRDRPIQHGW